MTMFPTLAAALPAVSTARPLAETAAGRVAIWRTVWPRALDHPGTGRGPGSFELVYDRARVSPRLAQTDPGDFAGPQQHAHNDSLEALVERGVPGVFALWLIVVGAVRVAGRRPRSLPSAAAGAVVVAAAAFGLVDFPWARPAEVSAVWGALAVLSLRDDESRP